MEEVAIECPQPWLCQLVWFIIDGSISRLMLLNQFAVIIVCNMVDGKLRPRLGSSSAASSSFRGSLVTGCDGV